MKVCHGKNDLIGYRTIGSVAGQILGGTQQILPSSSALDRRQLLVVSLLERKRVYIAQPPSSFISSSPAQTLPYLSHHFTHHPILFRSLNHQLSPHLYRSSKYSSTRHSLESLAAPSILLRRWVQVCLPLFPLASGVFAVVSRLRLFEAMYTSSTLDGTLTILCPAISFFTIHPYQNNLTSDLVPYHRMIAALNNVRRITNSCADVSRELAS